MTHLASLLKEKKVWGGSKKKIHGKKTLSLKNTDLKIIDSERHLSSKSLFCIEMTLCSRIHAVHRIHSTESRYQKYLRDKCHFLHFGGLDVKSALEALHLINDICRFY